MKALCKILLVLTAVAAPLVAYPASVQAVPTTYQYTGNPFTDVSGVYTTSDFVTAMVTLAGPLGANMPLTQVTPTAFTLSDRVQTITNLNAIAPAEFEFATDATGAITAWTVNVFNQLGAIHTDNAITGPVDQGYRVDAQGRLIGLAASRNPGAWRTAIPAPDAGSTL